MQTIPFQLFGGTSVLLRPKHRHTLSLTHDKITLYDLQAREELCTLDNTNFSFSQFSTDGKTLALRQGGNIIFFDLTKNRFNKIREVPATKATFFKFSDTSSAIYTLNDNGLSLQDVRNLAVLQTKTSDDFRQIWKHIIAVRWLPKVNRFIVILKGYPGQPTNIYDDKYLALFDIDECKLLGATRAYRSYGYKIAFDGEGLDSLFITSEDERYLLTSYRVFSTLDFSKKISSEEIGDTTFTEDGKRLISWSRNMDIVEFDLETGNRLSAFHRYHANRLIVSIQSLQDKHLLVREREFSNLSNLEIYYKMRGDGFLANIIRPEFFLGICSLAIALMCIDSHRVIAFLCAFLGATPMALPVTHQKGVRLSSTLQSIACMVLMGFVYWKLPHLQGWLGYFAVVMLVFLSLPAQREASQIPIMRVRILISILGATMIGMSILYPLAKMYITGFSQYLPSVFRYIDKHWPQYIGATIFYLVIFTILSIVIYTSVRWLSFVTTMTWSPLRSVQRVPLLWFNAVFNMSVLSRLEPFPGFGLPLKAIRPWNVPVVVATFAFRMMQKGLSVFLLPIVFLCIPFRLNRQGAKELIFVNHRSRLKNILILASILTLILFATRIVVFGKTTELSKWLLESPFGQMFQLHIAPGKLHLWHITAVINSILTLILASKWDRYFVALNDLRKPVPVSLVRWTEFLTRLIRVLSSYNWICFYLLFFDQMKFIFSSIDVNWSLIPLG